MKRLLSALLAAVMIITVIPLSANADYDDYEWSDILDISAVDNVSVFTDKYGISQKWITASSDHVTVTLLMDAYPMDLGSCCYPVYEEDGFFYIGGDTPDPASNIIFATDEYGDEYMKAGSQYIISEPGIYLFDCANASMCLYLEVPGSTYDENASGFVSRFLDVAPEEYYFEPVEWAVENGITVGTSDTTFSPDTECTRGQILTFLWRAAGCPPHYMGSSPITDIAVTDYYYDAVLWAYANGILDTKFGFADPNAPCTRAMTVQFLWLFSGAQYMEDAAPFTDVPASADYAMAVSWALENGITAGTSETTFSPGSTCTRGQIVTFLWRSLVK